MSRLIHKSKTQQELRALFEGKFIENKPIPFPSFNKKYGYSNLFYWAHLEAKETGEFPLHPHEGFEIMTFVLKGEIEHFDTATNIWTPIKEGGFQVIQAGNGVYHSEKIKKGSKVFQIWFDPDFSKSLKNHASYKDYDSKFIEAKQFDGKKIYEYIGNSKVKNQTENLTITKEIFEKGSHSFVLDDAFIYSIYVIEGNAFTKNLDIQNLVNDDYITIQDSTNFDLEVSENLELFIVKTPKKISYKTV